MKIKPVCLWIFLLTLTIFAAGPAPCSAPVRICIFPFTIHSDADLSFMRAGITDMLRARLTHPGKSDVFAAPVSGKPLSPAEALSLAQENKADYMVLGSLTVFGNAVSTDARLVRVDSGEETVVFHEAGSQKGDAILQADRFASQVNHTVFGMAPPAPPKHPLAAPQAQTQKGPAQAPAPPAAPQTGAPQAAGSPAGVRKAASPPKLPAPSTQKPPASEIWRSRPMASAVAGMAVGDVNGDGAPDIITIDRRKVEVFRYGSNGMARLAEFDNGVQNSLLAVDAADLDGDGAAEICVSALDFNAKPASFILKWDGFTVKPLVESAPWHIRILNHPEKGPIVVGQRQAKTSQNVMDRILSSNIFLGRVTPLAVNGRELMEAPGPGLPADLIVYGFAMGDAMNNGTIQTVAFTDTDRIRVTGPDGRILWTSNTTYGGGVSYLEIPSSSAQKEMRKGERRYLPIRLWVGDINGDGTFEVVAPANKDVSRRLFSRFRVYQSGRIEVLSWTNLTFKSVWQTDDVSGYIADFTVADLSGDNRKELVFAITSGLDGLLGKTESYIVVVPVPM